ncbi:MAG TPA: SLC13 family permease [Methanospirillum sp.]|nr:SLC13 family permease [Methanospirillum sp.]
MVPGQDSFTQLSIIILGLVFVLITVRQIGRFRFRIWQVMVCGAILVLITGQISPGAALQAINADVMLFLSGMFVIGEAVCASGYLTRISERISRYATSRDTMLILMIGLAGGSSVLLMNDTIAIIGVPLTLSLAARYQIPQKTALLALCFALTTGSVTSPIGNPQNFLIASYAPSGDPFTLFASGLLIPTLLCLALVFLIIRRDCGREGLATFTIHESSANSNRCLTVATQLSLCLLPAMIGIRVAAGFMGYPDLFPLAFIALIAAVPVILLPRERLAIIRAIDWPTLLFFAAMFILMQSVYDSGWFQAVIPFADLTTVPLLMGTSIIISQCISNVPFIALFQPIITGAGLSPGKILALAAGSTIAGNLTILGAASNVIVVQQAERYGVAISFAEFLKAGLPLTILQGGVYCLWLIYFV